MNYRVWGAMLEAYCKLEKSRKQLPNSRKCFRLWGNLPQGPIDKTVKDYSNSATEGLCWSLKLAVDTSNTYSVNKILASDH